MFNQFILDPNTIASSFSLWYLRKNHNAADQTMFLACNVWLKWWFTFFRSHTLVSVSIIVRARSPSSRNRGLTLSQVIHNWKSYWKWCRNYSFWDWVFSDLQSLALTLSYVWYLLFKCWVLLCTWNKCGNKLILQCSFRKWPHAVIVRI